MNVRAIGTVGVLAVALATAAVPASATATQHHRASTHKRVTATPADRAATHAYLIATEQADEAQLANLAQSNAAREALAGQISSECHGVLAGSPPPEQERSIESILPQTQGTYRLQGERNRQSGQRQNLKVELSYALDSPSKQINHEALAKLLGALSPLKWSDHTLTALVHVIVVIGQEELATVSPPACADMRSWVTSGYKTLTPASKEFEKHTAALLIHAFEVFALVLSSDISKPFEQLFAPYQSPADNALAHHDEALAAQLNGQTKTRETVVTRLEAAVGLPAPKPEPPIERPQSKPVVVDRGRTAAGTRFVVRAKRASHALRSGCSANVSVEEPSQASGGGLLNVIEGNDTERCLSRSHLRPEQHVSCESGLLTIEANLRPAARSVRLALSDNRTITSSAIRVPARLGGPVGLYYQAVRGPSPIPVSLTELDAHGNTLTVLKLNAVVECTKHPRKGFEVLPLAHGRIPQGGPEFAILGEHYRELGQAHFELHVGDEGGAEPFGIGGHGGIFAAGGESGLGSAGRLFATQTSTGCTPQPYAIVYGLLKAPRDTVFARVSGQLVPLNTVAIPARLHAHGVLAYGAFSPIPTELVVTDAHGKTVTTYTNLGEEAQGITETCEGESEG